MGIGSQATATCDMCRKAITVEVSYYSGSVSTNGVIGPGGGFRTTHSAVPHIPPPWRHGSFASGLFCSATCEDDYCVKKAKYSYRPNEYRKQQEAERAKREEEKYAQLTARMRNLTDEEIASIEKTFGPMKDR